MLFNGNNTVTHIGINVETQPTVTEQPAIVPEVVETPLYTIQYRNTNAYDWITVPDDTLISHKISFGKQTNYSDNPTYELTGLAEGEYEIRAKLNKSYSKQVNLKKLTATSSLDDTIVTTEGTAVESMNVILGFTSGLFQVNETTGDLEDYTVEIFVGYRVYGSGSEWAGKNISLTKHTTSAFAYAVPFDGLTPNKYEIKAHMVAEVVDDLQHTAVITIDHIQEGIPDDFRYPNVGLFAMDILATDQISGGMPTVRFITNRKYVYVWDGTTWVAKAANNPAWICYDILVNKTYGASISPEKMILDEFQEWADYCDEIEVTCNIVFDEFLTLATALNNISILGRGSVLQRGNKFGCMVDKPTQAVQMFTIGNTEIDSFQESFMNLSDRANCVEITYNDPDKDFTNQIITVRDTSFNYEDQVLQTNQIRLYGCTDSTVAYNHGIFQLNCNKHLLRTAVFNADIDAIACTIGDVIKIQNDTCGWGFGGRIQSAGVNWVTINEALPIADSLKILIRDNATDEVTEYDIASYDSETGLIRLTVAFDKIPDVYSIYSADVETTNTKEFRVLSITRDSDQKRKITAIEYYPEVYETNELITDNLYQGDNLNAIFNENGGSDYVTLIPTLYLDEKIIKAKINVVWGFSYALTRIFYRPIISNAWKIAGEYTGNQCIIDELSSNTEYVISVCSKNQSAESGYLKAVTTPILANPAFVVSLSLQEDCITNNNVVQSNISVNWDILTNTETAIIDHYDIWHCYDTSTADDFNIVKTKSELQKIGTTTEGFFIHENALINTTHYYFVKPVTTLNHSNSPENETWGYNNYIYADGISDVIPNIEGLTVSLDNYVLNIKWTELNILSVIGYKLEIITPYLTSWTSLSSSSYVFDESYYLTQKLAQLQEIYFEDGAWETKTTAELKTELSSVYNLTPEEHYTLYGHSEGLYPSEQNIGFVYSEDFISYIKHSPINYTIDQALSYEGDYQIRIKAVAADNRCSELWTTVSLSIAKPSIPVITTSPILWGISLDIDYITDNCSLVEIYYSVDTVFANASLLTVLNSPTTNYVHSDLPLFTSYYYWARCLGTNNIWGELSAYTLGSVATSAAGYLDNIVTESALTTALQEKINDDSSVIDLSERLDTITTDDGTLAGLWDVKIQASDLLNAGATKNAGIGLYNDGTKTQCAILADQFVVMNQDNSEKIIYPFIIDSATGIVGIRGDLLVDGSVSADILASDVFQSNDFSSSSSGWKLDRSTGLAEFYNMIMRISSTNAAQVRSDLNVDDGATNTTNTSQLTDGAGLGTTADWDNISGTDKPDDNATRNTGDLADLDVVSNTHVTGVTEIMGGRVKTDRITTENGSYIDLAGSDIFLNTLGVLMLGATSQYIYGMSAGGMVTKIDSSDKYNISFSDFQAITIDRSSIYPNTDGGFDCGTSTCRWNWVRCKAISTATTSYYDIIDDLAALHNIRANIDGTIDTLTLPNSVTTYEQDKAQIKQENGELLTDEDIDEILQDKEDLGGYVGINLGEMVALIEGSVRQLDKETSDLILQLCDWLNESDKETISTQQQIDLLKEQNSLLEKRIAILEKGV